MERLHWNEIEAGIIYFRVMVGTIDRIVFPSKTLVEDELGWRCEVKLIDLNWTSDYFLNDMGINNDRCSYVNHLNRVFKTSKEALDWINTNEYRFNLERHHEKCDYWDMF